MTMYVGIVLFAFGYLFVYTSIEGKGKINPLYYMKKQA